MSWEEPWYADTGPDRENPVRIDFDDIKASSDLAYLISVGGKKYWIPKSQSTVPEKTGGRFSGRGWIEIPEWLAIEKGLV